MGQEIITHQETQKYKVINNSFKIKLPLNFLKLKFQVFAHNCNFHKLKLDCLRQLHSFLSATLKTHVPLLFAFVANLLLGWHHYLSQHIEMGLVS